MCVLTKNKWINYIDTFQQWCHPADEMISCENLESELTKLTLCALIKNRTQYWMYKKNRI